MAALFAGSLCLPLASYSILIALGRFKQYFPTTAQELPDAQQCLYGDGGASLFLPCGGKRAAMKTERIFSYGKSRLKARALYRSATPAAKRKGAYLFSWILNGCGNSPFTLLL